MIEQTRARDRGFTLIEMLVTLVVLAIVTLGIFRVFTAANRSYDRGTESIDGQQNARAALSWMSRELRSAKGFNLIRPDEVTILSDKSVRNQIRTLRLDRDDRDGDGDTSELLLVRNPDDDGTAGVFVDEIAVGIDSLAFLYRDGAGNPTTSRASVQEVEVAVFATGTGMRDRASVPAGGTRQVGMSTRVKCRNLGKSLPTQGDVTAPAPVTGIHVVPGCGILTAAWNANTETDLAGYLLSYAKGSGGSPYGGIDAAQGPSPIFVGNVTTYTLTGLALGSTYYVNVQAVDTADNTSLFGTEASAAVVDAVAPSTPTGLTARVVGDADVQVYWNPVSDWDVAWYRVSWHDDVQPSVVHTDSTRATSLVVSGLTEGTVLTFEVSAEDACGNSSGWSAPTPITMIACAHDVGFPSVPAGVGVSPGDEFIRMTWSSVSDPDVVAYQIYFQEAGNTLGTTLMVGNVTAYSLHGLTNGTTYELQVAAVDGCGNQGGYSGLLSATPQDCAGNTSPPDTPAGLAAVDLGVGDRVQLSWGRPPQGDVLGYRVQWGTSPGTWDGAVDVGNVLFYTVGGLVAGTTHYFTVASYDVCGNESPPAPPVSATPTWGCACPPIVQTTTPAGSSILQDVVPWQVSALACSTSTIARVEFRIDGSTRYADYSAPYEFGDFGAGWNTVLETDGPHLIVAVGIDAAGCETADTLTVFVDNSGLGASCLAVAPGATAAVGGAFQEAFDIDLLNLSSVDTYDLHSLVMDWDDPMYTIVSVSLDGVPAWYPSSFPGASPGDTLPLVQTVAVPPDTPVRMSVSGWDRTGASPPAIDVPSTHFEVTFLGSPVATCGPHIIPMPCRPGVTIESVNSPNPYDVWGVPQPGDEYHTDVTHQLTWLPPELEASVLLRTPEADVDKGGALYLNVSFDRDVTVWIAYDPRGTPPNWIKNNYVTTGSAIGVSDPGTSTLDLWRRDLAAGTWQFRGNKAQGWSGTVATNYVLFVTCQ